MLSIDINSNKNTLVVTASEMVNSSNNDLELELFNFFTNVTYTYPISITYSNVRYDKIEIWLDQEKENRTLETGQYRYMIWEIIQEESSNRVVEAGLAKVVNSGTASTYIELPYDEEDDDFITYG